MKYCYGKKEERIFEMIPLLSGKEGNFAPILAASSGVLIGMIHQNSVEKTSRLNINIADLGN